MAQQRCESTVLAAGNRRTNKVKNNTNRRHIPSVPTLVTHPTSTRNPQLSPLQSWWGLQHWGGLVEIVAVCLLHLYRVIINRSTPHSPRWAWLQRGKSVSNSEISSPSELTRITLMQSYYINMKSIRDL